jgi:hypothetical protein
MDGRVNRRELSINVVMSNKPKLLTGLSQKGTGVGTAFPHSPGLRGGACHRSWVCCTNGREEVGVLEPRFQLTG